MQTNEQGRPEPNVLVPDGDPWSGRTIFEEHCDVCHGPDRTSGYPHLVGFFGKPAASRRPQSNFSRALKNSGITWTEKHLYLFLIRPGKYVKGTSMAFSGLERAQDRADLIAYLKTL